MPTSVEKEILKTINYFDFFDYQPTLDEIHLFLTKKVTKKKLSQIFNELVIKNTLVEYGKNTIKYTQGRYGINKISNLKFKIKNSLLRQAESKKKLEKIKPFVKILSKFKQIKLIGLSGSMAMMNVSQTDDIDLFIITKKNRLFTGRLISLFLAQVVGVRRKRMTVVSQDKVCLNLFFDEANLSVPKFKRNEYTAHEILQMKPLINKDQTYERFLRANSWVIKIFPNAKSNFKFKIKNFLDDCLETVVKTLQLWNINKHKTTEIITNTQLWFFPEDFQKKASKLI